MTEPIDFVGGAKIALQAAKKDVEVGKHIRFVPGPDKPKTKTWMVESNESGCVLGWIAWYSQWRTYGFFPDADTVFEEDCLRDIADFCERKTIEHKKMREKHE